MKSSTPETAQEGKKARWERDVAGPAIAKSPERTPSFTTISGRPIERSVHRRRHQPARLRARPRRSRRVSLHARHPPDAATAASSGRCGSSPGSARRRRPTRATSSCSAAGGTGPERRVRSADADGPRSGPSAVARRGRQVRRDRHVARRHGSAVRRHPARRHHDVDDDQLAGADDLRDVSGRRRAAGRGLEDAVGHDSERHPQGVHRAEGIHLPAASVDAAHHRRLRSSARRTCRSGTRFR